jgi:hypothetical protein
VRENEGSLDKALRGNHSYLHLPIAQLKHSVQGLPRAEMQIEQVDDITAQRSRIDVFVDMNAGFDAGRTRRRPTWLLLVGNSSNEIVHAEKLW